MCKNMLLITINIIGEYFPALWKQEVPKVAAVLPDPPFIIRK